MDIQKKTREELINELQLLLQENELLKASEEKRAAELIIANSELAFQRGEKVKRVGKFITANIEPDFQNEEKRKQAAELIMAKIKIVAQGKENEKLSSELVIANIMLVLQEELIRAKEQAEESEKKFKLLYENAPLSYQSLDANACLIDVNPTWLLTLGYNREDVIGHPFGGFMTQESAESIKERFPAFIEKGEIHNYEFEMVRKDGTQFMVSYDGKIGYDALGHFNKTHCIFRDITDRKQAEDALKESEKNYKILVEKMPDGVYKSTHAGKFIDANHAMVEMLGYNSKEELLAVDIKNDLYIEDSERNNINLDESNKELGVFQLRKKDGSAIWVEDHGWYSFDESGEITYHEGVMRDVTERIQKEQELNVAKKRAEESDRLKSAFLANMSHEIRTPMNGILGFAELLKEPGLTGETQMEYIQVIEKSGARMLNIINDIIDISKIESGLMEVYMQVVNINEQIEDIITFFIPEAERKGIQISFNNSLPKKEANLRTDREKLNSILTNLIKNAIKYTNKGSIEFGYSLLPAMGLIAATGELVEPAKLLFYVKDTGIGIAKNRQKAVFERFIQADIIDKHAYQGAGLGLAICKAYIEMLGGAIWVESDEAKGSTFYFTLPYQTESIKEDSFKNVSSPSIDEVLINNLKIVIAEDDESSQSFIFFAVRKFGSDIIIVQTGTEAVAACLKNPGIDLVLMDLKMPGMDGYEATRQIREFNKTVIIIAQTAYALEGDKEIALAAGCNDYISKPIKIDELKQMIEKYFKK